MATRAGFLAFIRNIGITSAQLPDASTDIDSALALSLQITPSLINDVSPVMYDMAAYNLGTHNLIEFANDQTGQTFFSGLRTTYTISGFVPGTIASSSDEGTSESMLNPDFLKTLMLSDLQYIKTPYGRQYLSIAQRIGTNWGLS